MSVDDPIQTLLTNPQAPQWSKVNGMMPAIVQDADTLRVLMLGYMDPEALKKTCATNKVTFFSRSKQRLWTKGETSGHYLHLVALRADCDCDTLLVTARPRGPTCHNGTTSCFDGFNAAPGNFLGQLDHFIEQRFEERPPDSYTTHLFNRGIRRIAQKVGEEGVETALAAVIQDDNALLGEAADLLFHLMVLLRARSLSLQDAVAVLDHRHTPREAV